MSSLAAKARFNKLGGVTGTAQVTPPPGTPPGSSGVPHTYTIEDANLARTAAVADNHQIIEFTNAADIAYTIKAYAEVPIPIGGVLYALARNTGQVTFVPDTGVTFDEADSYATRAEGSLIAMKHVELNRWQALGDLEAAMNALSVLGRAAGTIGAIGEITATANGQALIMRAGALLFAALAASEISNTPAGGIAAATVQLAINELDTEKANLASPTFTGTPAAPTAAPGTNTTQLATTAFVTALGALLAPLASPAFTGTPTAPTAAPGTNTTQLATTAFVAALGALKANLASPTFTGTPAAPTAGAGTNTTQLATTAFVAAAIALLAPLASPTFTGVPAGPTAAPGTNTTQFSTTAFVTAAVALLAPLASPTFTGVPLAPTAAGGTNNTQIATTAFVAAATKAVVATCVESLPGAAVGAVGVPVSAGDANGANRASAALTNAVVAS